MDEMRKTGGYNSRFFWRRAKVKKGKGLTKLKDDSGVVITEEDEVANMAGLHFETLGTLFGLCQQIGLTFVILYFYIAF